MVKELDFSGGRRGVNSGLRLRLKVGFNMLNMKDNDRGFIGYRKKNPCGSLRDTSNEVIAAMIFGGKELEGK